MVNRVGPTFVHRIAEASGEHPPAIVRAYLLTREVFGLVPLWRSIEVLDNEVPDLAQSEMLSECGQLVFRATLWFLRSRRLHEDMAATIEHFAPAVEAVYRCLDPLLAPMGTATEEAARIARFEAQGVPNEVARRVAAGHALYAALDMAEVASVTSCPVETVAHVYFAVSDELDVPWLQERIAALPADTYWQTLAKGAMQDDLSGLQRNVSAQVLAAGADGTVPELVARWKAANGSAVERVTRLLGELRAMTTTDAAMLSVALRELRNLA